jgi:hypothetical protein
MSVEFSTEVGPEWSPPQLGDGLTWEPPITSGPQSAGQWNVHRPGISTRSTWVRFEPPTLTVTIAAGASVEDCDLALALVRAGTGTVTTENHGPIPVAQLDVLYDHAWMQGQLDSAARVTATLARDRGMIALPGPTRDVWIGPRTLAELAPEQPGAADRLVAIMRRVLWPHPRYFAASQLTATSPDGEQFTLAILGPDTATVLPHSDRLGIAPLDDEPVALIAREHLLDLPVEVTFLDDHNQLVESVPVAEWPDLYAAARRFDGD